MNRIIDKNDNNEAKKRILQYANDVMHEQLTHNEIVVVAIHNRADPRKFTIVSDSEYDRALEGISLIFENPEDFKRVFPEYAAPPPVVLAPNMEMDQKKGIAVPIHKDPYPLRNIFSLPKPANPDINSPENVLNDDDEMTWAVNKNPAQLILDLGQDVDIGTVWVKWNNEGGRQHKFTIAVATDAQITSDKKTFAVVPHLQEKWTSGNEQDTTKKNIDIQLEPYNLATDPEMLTTARYVMIKVYGNTIDNWATIKRVQVTRAVAIKSMEQGEPKK